MIQASASQLYAPGTSLKTDSPTDETCPWVVYRWEHFTHEEILFAGTAHVMAQHEDHKNTKEHPDFVRMVVIFEGESSRTISGLALGSTLSGPTGSRRISPNIQKWMV